MLLALPWLRRASPFLTRTQVNNRVLVFGGERDAGVLDDLWSVKGLDGSEPCRWVPEDSGSSVDLQKMWCGAMKVAEICFLYLTHRTAAEPEYCPALLCSADTGCCDLTCHPAAVLPLRFRALVLAPMLAAPARWTLIRLRPAPTGRFGHAATGAAGAHAMAAVCRWLLLVVLGLA